MCKLIELNQPQKQLTEPQISCFAHTSLKTVYVWTDRAEPATKATNRPTSTNVLPMWDTNLCMCKPVDTELNQPRKKLTILSVY